MEKDFPEYLFEIMRPTPSGTAKLLAAWNNLSLENQIKILLSLEDSKYPFYLQERIFRNALESENAYIRYLVAKRFYYDDRNPEHQEVKKKVEADSSPLVKYCSYESEWGFDRDLDNPDIFFALPHEARLAKVRILSAIPAHSLITSASHVDSYQFMSIIRSVRG